MRLLSFLPNSKHWRFSKIVDSSLSLELSLAPNVTFILSRTVLWESLIGRQFCHTLHPILKWSPLSVKGGQVWFVYWTLGISYWRKNKDKKVKLEHFIDSNLCTGDAHTQPGHLAHLLTLFLQATQSYWTQQNRRFISWDLNSKAQLRYYTQWHNDSMIQRLKDPTTIITLCKLHDKHLAPSTSTNRVTRPCLPSFLGKLETSE